MKKTWKLVLCMALAVTMLSCAALAAGDGPEVAVNKTVYTALTDNAVAVADGTVTVTIPASMITDGEQYVVVLVKPKTQAATAEALLSADYELGESTVTYIDQTAATSSGVTFSGKPLSMSSCLVLLGGKDASGTVTTARVIGAIKTSGVTVTGTATAKGASTGDVTVTIKDGSGTVGSATVTSGGSYSISGVPAQAGLTVEVSSTIKGKQDKVKYVTRTYELDATAATELNVELWPNGDANGDGRVSAGDATVIFNHVRLGSTNKLTGYGLKCADTNGDGRIAAGDATVIFNHVRLGSTNVLW